MTDRSPNKIKVEKTLYYHQKNSKLTWKDIKHLQLEDDDVIHSNWVEDDNFEYHGYWYAEVIRKVEETDKEYAKRMKDIARDAAWAKERRYESYLKLKKEFENTES
jgi:hypothetical protein